MSSTPRAGANPKVVLAVLIVAYTFNFLDRQILGILAGPIKAELGLSDSQLGLMGGLAFALFYTGLGVPIAALADRWSRTWIMTGALTLWSGFTALCGLATGFWQLFLCRMGVGIGEAGGVAPAYSLISDYFPKEQRARALAAYSFGIPIGSALGILFGGLIAHAVDWRAAFIAVGIAGVALAPIFRLIVKEPPREASPPPAPVAAGAPPR
ncbi:MAG: MFS transporter, partial [Phenylobacterium sp.]|uniref:spinster family MFS transporter n=1 Tax=Phenylobacterium sp. TaxID=1871053 RepID=UPI001A246C53